MILPLSPLLSPLPSPRSYVYRNVTAHHTHLATYGPPTTTPLMDSPTVSENEQSDVFRKGQYKKLPWHWLLILSLLVAILSMMVYSRPSVHGLEVTPPCEGPGCTMSNTGVHITDTKNDDALSFSYSTRKNTAQGMNLSLWSKFKNDNYTFPFVTVIPPGANEGGRPRKAERYLVLIMIL